MKVLSLFDGMACGMLAMQGAGVGVERYVAYEIDKYAVQTSTHNFPMIEHRGDVFPADFTEFRGFDAVVGGSPCTKWSIAQSKDRETEAEGVGWELFSQYVRAIHEVKPKFFIYENNKSMSRAIRSSIDKAFGFEATEINSASVSAQNRQRLYWVGKRNADGAYSKVDVLPPADRGIMLVDILESGTAWQDKSFAYTTRCQGATPHDTLGRHRHTMVAEPVFKELTNRELEYMVRETRDGRNHFDFDHHHDATRDKSSCITANTAKGVPYNVLVEPVPGYIACEWDGNGKPTVATLGRGGKTYPVYEVEDGKITIAGRLYSIKLADGFYIFRKLTVRECMRLQTVPEWYEFPVSDTQAYKMLGNGWTVEVIKHLVQSVLAEGIEDWML